MRKLYNTAANGAHVLTGIAVSFALFIIAGAFFLFLVIGPLWLSLSLNSAWYLLIYIPTCFIIGRLYQDTDVIF